jgi:hypothetical protein
MDEMHEVIELTDAELDAVAAGQVTGGLLVLGIGNVNVLSTNLGDQVGAGVVGGNFTVG